MSHAADQRERADYLESQLEEARAERDRYRESLERLERIEKAARLIDQAQLREWAVSHKTIEGKRWTAADMALSGALSELYDALAAVGGDPE